MNMITVIGFGSLLSEESARQTAPTLANFRLGKVAGYKRIFNKAGIVFFERDKVPEESLEVSSCATRKDDNFEILCSVFECTEDDFLSMYEREHRFRWIEVGCETEKGVVNGRMCTEYNDLDYLLNKCVTETEYIRRVGQFYRGKIWRNDILPYPPYLKHCLRAARSQGESILENYLDTTFLADGETSIRIYIKDNATYQDWSDGHHSYHQD